MRTSLNAQATKVASQCLANNTTQKAEESEKTMVSSTALCARTCRDVMRRTMYVINHVPNVSRGPGLAAPEYVTTKNIHIPKCVEIFCQTCRLFLSFMMHSTHFLVLVVQGQWSKHYVGTCELTKCGMFGKTRMSSTALPLR